MAPDVEADDLLARYVLGELSEAEEERVEERYLEDDLFFERLALVEDELIDRYVRRQSTEAERRDFEAKYLTTPLRRRKVESARQFARLINKVSPAGPPGVVVSPRPNPFFAFLHNHAPALSLSLAAAAGVLVLCCWWMYGETRRLRDELGQTRIALQQQAEQQREQAGQPTPGGTAQPPREQTPEVAGPPAETPPKEGGEPQRRRDGDERRAQTATFATFILPPASTRGGVGRQPLIIRRGNRFVRLIMYLEENPYGNYRVSLEGADGDTVLSRNVSKGQKTQLGEQITLDLPADVFKHRDYILRIEAQTPQNESVTVDATSLDVVRRGTTTDPRP